jgi:hypothetical protein
MTAILASLLSNPTLIALFAAIVGGLGFGFHQRLAGARAERNKQAAKDAKNRELIIRDVNRAAEAGARVGTASANELRNDPFNRDNASRR